MVVWDLFHQQYVKIQTYKWPYPARCEATAQRTCVSHGCLISTCMRRERYGHAEASRDGSGAGDGVRSIMFDLSPYRLQNNKYLLLGCFFWYEYVNHGIWKLDIIVYFNVLRCSINLKKMAWTFWVEEWITNASIYIYIYTYIYIYLYTLIIPLDPKTMKKIRFYTPKNMGYKCYNP